MKFRFAKHPFERSPDKEATPLDYERALSRLDELYSEKKDGDVDGIDAVGVIAGIKPVSMIQYSPEVAGLMADLNLKYTVFKLTPDREFAEMTISKDLDLAAQAAELFLKQPTLTDEEERILGKLLGYPPTGTDYYIRRKHSVQNTGKLLPIIQPRHLEGKVQDEFIECHLSKDHWQEELNNYVFPLWKATKALMPEMYRQMELGVWRRGMSRMAIEEAGGEPPSSTSREDLEYVE